MAERSRRRDSSTSATSPLDQLVEAWWTNHRVNLRLIDAITDEGMAATLSTRGGRDVVRQLAHLHNVRVWHLEAKARPLARGLRVFATQERPPRRELVAALAASAEAVERMLRGMAAGTVRGVKRGPAQALAYFVAHESHHRGNILLTLKQTGHAPPQSERYALWDWDRL